MVRNKASTSGSSVLVRLPKIIDIMTNPVRRRARCSNLNLNIVVCEAGISPDPRKCHTQASWIPDPGKADTFLLLSRSRVGALPIIRGCYHVYRPSVSVSICQSRASKEYGCLQRLYLVSLANEVDWSISNCAFRKDRRPVSCNSLHLWLWVPGQARDDIGVRISFSNSVRGCTSAFPFSVSC